MAGKLAIGDLYAPGASVGLWDENRFVISSSTEPDGGGAFAGIWVNVDPLSYIMTMDQEHIGTVGVGHIWYEVQENIVIDADFANNTEPFFSMYNVGDLSGEIQMWPQPFMLGFRLGAEEPGLNDVFGWAEFTYDGTTLSLVDSAAENDGVGIIAGQYQQVPEPATIFLFGLGGLGAWILRRNQVRFDSEGG